MHLLIRSAFKDSWITTKLRLQFRRLSILHWRKAYGFYAKGKVGLDVSVAFRDGSPLFEGVTGELGVAPLPTINGKKTNVMRMSGLSITELLQTNS